MMSNSRFLSFLSSFLASLPAASVKEAQTDIPSPVEDERREAGEQTEEPSAEAAERRQEAAQRAEEAETGGEGRRHQDAPPPGDLQEETRWETGLLIGVKIN